MATREMVTEYGRKKGPIQHTTAGCDTCCMICGPKNTGQEPKRMIRLFVFRSVISIIARTPSLLVSSSRAFEPSNKKRSLNCLQLSLSGKEKEKQKAIILNEVYDFTDLVWKRKVGVPLNLRIFPGNELLMNCL